MLQQGVGPLGHVGAHHARADREHADPRPGHLLGKGRHQVGHGGLARAVRRGPRRRDAPESRGHHHDPPAPPLPHGRDDIAQGRVHTAQVDLDVVPPEVGVDGPGRPDRAEHPGIRHDQVGHAPQGCQGGERLGHGDAIGDVGDQGQHPARAVRLGERGQPRGVPASAATRQPCASRSSPIARPIPRLAPVIRATPASAMSSLPPAGSIHAGTRARHVAGRRSGSMRCRPVAWAEGRPGLHPPESARRLAGRGQRRQATEPGPRGRHTCVDGWPTRDRPSGSMS